MCYEQWALHVIKQKVFYIYIYICSFYTIFYAISISSYVYSFNRRKSICEPN